MSEIKENEMLNKFATNLTEKGKKGLLDKVWGRDNEILKATEILGRRKKNNLIITGLAGVGKTSILTGLVLKILNGDVAQGLLNKVVYSLDAGSITAGTQYRGQMEDRLKKILTEAENDENVILFIDEIHMILDSGGSSAINIGNIMKPYLTSGKMQVIGATTTEEYTKLFEKDGALNRRFHNLYVDEPSNEACIEILNNCIPYYEEYHNVEYPKEMINKLPLLAKKYIKDRHLPDSVIDIIDEVGAKIKTKRTQPNKKYIQLKEEYAIQEEKKYQLIKEENWDEIAYFKPNVLDKLAEQLEAEEKKVVNKTDKLDKVEIKDSDVLEVVSNISKIPLDRLSTSGKANIKKLEKNFKQNIIGQDEACTEVVKALKRSVMGFNDTSKPIGVYLLLGKSGSGKTHLAKQLSNIWYGKNMIRIDMSEYQDKHSASGLIGTHAGYVGYDDGGNLTEQVKQNPYSLVLLDEVEKANKDVLNTLLQIFDDGFVTDGQGRKIDFRNTIIIMTSNLGARKSDVKKPGYSGGNVVNLKDSTITEAKKHFTPELWNRIDKVITFNSLTKDDITKILNIEIKNFNKIISENGYKITVNPKVKDKIIEEGFDDKLGARPLKRAVENIIVDNVTDYLIENGEHKNLVLSWDVENDKLVIKEKEV